MDTYYHHLIFDNSLTDGNYFFSRVVATAPGQVEGVDGKLPVSGERFFNPPNSLRLAWLSVSGGYWQAEILTENFIGRLHPLAGDSLSFWCYSEMGISANALPQVGLAFPEGLLSAICPLADFVQGIPAGQWLQVKIPLQAFQTGSSRLDFNFIEKIIFSQGSSDGEHHTLYVDEIKVIDSSLTGLCQPPAGLKAAGFDCHVDLSWERDADPALAYYQVYRSTDGRDFQPVGIQNSAFQRYCDYVGPAHGVYSYRVKAVSHDYQESDFSEVVSAITHPMNDEELLDMVQAACYRYYWEGAHPDAGMALECIPGDENLVALGASGFGLAALIAAVDRGFISRPDGIGRMQKILRFLETADRFHGVWPHFLDGRTGKVIPLFGKYDDGGDLVETAFIMQTMLAARQYFDRPTDEETQIRSRITRLWEEVEWDWYRRSPESDFLFWHWSPDYEWYIDHPLIGWNETMIVYLLAIASPTHPVPASMYYSGWASQSQRAVEYRGWGNSKDGIHYANGSTFFGVKLPVAVGSGGPLFFLHYSFIGFDPHCLTDKYTNYFENSRAIALANQAYCIHNPGSYKEYSPKFWGLTASFDHTGYVPHEPSPWGDTGTVTPTGALASFPYVPDEAMAALKEFYYRHGRQMWGVYGFRDCYNPTTNYVSNIFMGLNQAPITSMIENYRSGLLWKCFMANPEMSGMLEKIQSAAPSDSESANSQ